MAKQLLVKKQNYNKRIKKLFHNKAAASEFPIWWGHWKKVLFQFQHTKRKKFPVYINITPSINDNIKCISLW